MLILLTNAHFVSIYGIRNIGESIPDSLFIVAIVYRDFVFGLCLLRCVQCPSSYAIILAV